MSIPCTCTLFPRAHHARKFSVPSFLHILQIHWACVSYLRLHPVSSTVLRSQQRLSGHLLRERWLVELIILKGALKATRQEIREREHGQVGVPWRLDFGVGEVFHSNIVPGEPRGADCSRWVWSLELGLCRNWKAVCYMLFLWSSFECTRDIGATVVRKQQKNLANKIFS